MLVFAQTVNLDVILVSAVPLEFSPTMFILLWPNIDTSCIFCQMLKFSGVGGVEHGQDSQRYKGVSSRTYHKYLLYFAYYQIIPLFVEFFVTSHHCCQQPLYLFDQITRILVLSLWRHLLNMETKLLLAKHIVAINITKLV